MNRKRLEQQLTFLKEIDKIKNIFRRTRLLDDSRYENDAEHSWHIAVMAIILAEHANTEHIDIPRVLKMVLIHDIVEIDAGDTIIYDSTLREKNKQIESQAAKRIFGMLPEDQQNEFRTLWDEFEARQTPEAKFARALDRFEPIIQNVSTRGHAWQNHGISRKQAEAANKHIADGSREIWEYVKELFAESEKKGYFPRK